MPLAVLLRQVSKGRTGKEIVYTDAQLAQILIPQHFVEVRKTYGGPSPSETLRAIGVSKRSLVADDDWLKDARARLQAQNKCSGQPRLSLISATREGHHCAINVSSSSSRTAKPV